MINNPLENSGAGLKIDEDSSIYRRINEKLAKEKSFAEATINSLPGIFYLFTVE